MLHIYSVPPTTPMQFNTHGFGASGRIQKVLCRETGARTLISSPNLLYPFFMNFPESVLLGKEDSVRVLFPKKLPIDLVDAAARPLFFFLAICVTSTNELLPANELVLLVCSSFFFDIFFVIEAQEEEDEQK
mmetsp:Transcript_19676/g.30963  ORF Transcript_19676/g.30963 Transcript_19676/m.30963 type:complete len:132 (-) Transcript_19676:688-1083(-)